MSRERLWWGLVLLVIMAVGLLIGGRVWRPSEPPWTDAEAFRAWLWQSRPLDLLTQVGLILGGALGIAALLPDEGEEE